MLSVFPNSFNKRRVPVNPWIWALSEWSSVFKYKAISIGQQKYLKEFFRRIKQWDEAHRFYYTGVYDICCCKQFGKLAYKWNFSDDFFHFLHIFTSFLKSVWQTCFVVLQMTSHSVNMDISEERTSSCQIRETSLSLSNRAFLATFFSRQDFSKEGRKCYVRSKLKTKIR